MKTQRRFTEHRPPGKRVITLRSDHPAYKEGRTLFPTRVIDPADAPRLLKSGRHSHKLGNPCVKGKWAGMPIYSLTLEERATCPRTCLHWSDCYGNKMQFPHRHRHGPDLENRLEIELAALAEEHPGGFIVRLHILGDFYSTGYVRKWRRWLRRFPALYVFGYTARHPHSDAIGRMLNRLSARHWERFAIRFSNHDLPERTATTISGPARGRVAHGIVCPAQTADSDCCATCGLCWGQRGPIAFLSH